MIRLSVLACVAALLLCGRASAAFKTVVIDAGHGGHDAGGIPSNIIPEKGVALDVAKRLASRLRGAGLNTVMTRSTDVFVPLARRVAIANAQSNALFVSVHFNSATRRGARGVETFSCSDQGDRLARLIQARVASTTTGDNRGAKRAKYFVLRKCRNTAVLVECGFLTNPADVALARSATYRETLARQIAAAILEYRKSRP